MRYRPRFRPRPAVPLAAALALAALTPAAPAVAQTIAFGKNKVHYKEFTWRVLRSDRFDLYYYPEEENLARTALGIAEEAFDDVAIRMRHEVTRRVPLIIYATHQDFQETNVSPYFLPEGVAGFTEFLKGRVALPFNGSWADFRNTLHHELVHVFQLSRMEELYRLHYRSATFGPPLWFTEGMADHWAEPWDSTGDLFLRDLVLHDRLPAIPELWRLNGTFVLYKVGQDLVGFLERTWGPGVVPDVYDALWREPSFEKALERVTGLPVEELDARWRFDLARRYYPAVADAEPLVLAARPLAVEGGANFKAAVAPPAAGLPPDTFYFLSPRNGYTNIYRASLRGRETGVETVVRGQRRPEFESFHAFESRIDVSRDGLLAFVSKFHERDALFVYDLRAGRVAGYWQFEDLVGLRSPTWSPGGDEVIFAGLSQRGRQDLYRFSLETATLRPLTADRHLDDEPAWSPDGRTLAFVSDRGSADGEGRNIHLLDLETGRLERLTRGEAHDRGPAWNEDGSRLAFSSDRAGTPQLFVADRRGAMAQVTRLLGGAFDPEWLPGGRELLFTGMSDLRFGIYRLAVGEAADSLVLPIAEALPVPAAPPDSAGAIARAGADIVEADSTGTLSASKAAAEPTPAAPTGRAPSSDSAPPPPWFLAAVDSAAVRAEDRPYRAQYSLDFAQGGVAFEPTQNAGEGLQALLSDQLGDRLVFIQVANTAERFEDFASRMSVGATWFDLSRRLNRGLSLYHFAGDFYDELGYRYFERRVGGSVIASYPFSRYRRIESSLGLLYSDRGPDSFRPAREGFLALNSLSLVHDISLWTPTGPIDGWRYHLTLGLATNLEQVEVENVSAVVDLRRYFRTGLRTAYAVRLQARVSHGALPQRFVLGGSWTLRGYPRHALVGTRAVLLNQEWRFPVLTGAALGLPVGVLGLPPVEGALFLDAARAWEEGEIVDDASGSFGLGFRSSLGGFLVLRLDLSRRTDFRKVSSNTDVDFSVGFDY